MFNEIHFAAENVSTIAISTSTAAAVADSRTSYIQEELLPTTTPLSVTSSDRVSKTLDTFSLHSTTTPHRKSPYCLVNANMDLILVLDASSSIKIIDYRIMKDFVQTFLLEHFNLGTNRVRVGVIKYGNKVEVAITLGDYSSPEELIKRLSETKRVRGRPDLGTALEEVYSEFSVSSTPDLPKAVIIFINGRSRSNIEAQAQKLHADMAPLVFIVDVSKGSDDEGNLAIVGSDNPDRIIKLPRWTGSDSELIGPFADDICKNVKQLDGDATEETWLPRRTTVPGGRETPTRICEKVDYKADIIFVLESSDNVTDEDYTKMMEALNDLIDRSFDLSPDVVRVGFVEYSSEAYIPVALGHYEDKEHFFRKIDKKYKMGGTPVLLRGLDAVKEQFKRHGRENVSKAVLLITKGNNRGNAAAAVQELREKYGVDVFFLAIGASELALASLKRLVSQEVSSERVISFRDAQALLDEGVEKVGKTLCSYISGASDEFYTQEPPTRETTKREITVGITGPASIYPIPEDTEKSDKLAPLCKDGLLRPYQFTILVDITARSPEKDLKKVLDYISQFMQSRFLPESNRMQLNLLTVDSSKVIRKEVSFGVDVVAEQLASIVQNRGDELSAKLGEGIQDAINVATTHAIKGVKQFLLIISADGTSGDDTLMHADFARLNGLNIIPVSIREPTSTFLKDLAGGDPKRVIHSTEWSISQNVFDAWFAYTICGYITDVKPTKLSTTTVPIWPSEPEVQIVASQPSNVKVTPLSPTSVSVTWTCCTNTKSSYAIYVVPDSLKQKSKWNRIEATCRDSFGKRLEGLTTGLKYSICVVKDDALTNKSYPNDLKNCVTVKLDKDTVAPPDFKDTEVETTTCQCLCTEKGEAVVRPTCGDVIDPFRPISTLPPATSDECPCRVASHGGRCPSGYYLYRNSCYDIDECQQQNGGCSHGCVNTPGSFYCACPPSLIRDPLNPKICVEAAKAFDGIATIIGQYLEANQQGLKLGSSSLNNRKPMRYKTTIKSADNKTISIEWSAIPTTVKRALKWLF